MPGNHRSGRNRGAYSRRGRNVGLGSVDAALLAIADAQASLDMTDRQLEDASGISHGALSKLRLGRGYLSNLEKIATFFELRASSERSHHAQVI